MICVLSFWVSVRRLISAVQMQSRLLATNRSEAKLKGLWGRAWVMWIGHDNVVLRRFCSWRKARFLFCSWNLSRENGSKPRHSVAIGIPAWCFVHLFHRYIPMNSTQLTSIYSIHTCIRVPCEGARADKSAELSADTNAAWTRLPYHRYKQWGDFVSSAPYGAAWVGLVCSRVCVRIRAGRYLIAMSFVFFFL